MNNFTTAYETSQERVFKLSRYNSYKDNKPQPISLNWEELKKLTSKRLIRENKIGPAIGGAFFPEKLWRREGGTVKEVISLRNPTELAIRSPLRSNIFVEGLSLLILDFDGGAKRDEILACLKKLRCAAILYSTYTHLANGVEKYRLIIPLAEDISYIDYYDLWVRISAIFNFKNDPVTKDAARMQDLPSCPGSRENLAVYNEMEGEFLDISTVEAIDEQQVEIPSLFRRSSRKKRESTMSAVAVDDENFRRITSEQWVSSAVERTLEKLKEAIDGEKHYTLLSCSFNLGGFLYLAEEFSIVEEFEDRLFDALEGRAEDDTKAWDTIRRGLEAGAEEPWEMPYDNDFIDPGIKFFNPFDTCEAEENVKTNESVKSANESVKFEETAKTTENEKSESEKLLKTENMENVENVDGAKHRFENEPLSLTSQLRPVEPLKKDMLPVALRDWVFDSAERTNIPPDSVAIPVIIGLGSLLADITMRPKKFDDWNAVSNLWGFYVAPPGSKKSAAAAMGMKPLKELQDEALKKYNEEMKEFEPQRKIHEAKELAVKNALAKKAKEFAESNTTIDSEFHSIIREANLDELNPPVRKQYFANDPTIEAIDIVMQGNPRGFLLDYDEIAQFFVMLDKPGREGYRESMLSGWNGNKSSKITNRIGRGVVITPVPILSVFGTIQPDIIAEIVREASKEKRDGLIPRFQLAVYPDQVPYKQIDKTPDFEAKQRAFDIFKFCDTMTVETLGVKKEFEAQEISVRFSEMAQKNFDDWLHAIEHKRSNNRETKNMREHLAKYPSLMPSLALIFHCCDVADGAPAGPVSHEATMMAIRWCDYLESHARRIYGQSSDADITTLERLAEKIALLPNPFKLSDLTRKKWAGLSNQREVENLLLDLEEKNWLCCEIVKTKTRPSKTYHVHPALLENTSQIPHFCKEPELHTRKLGFEAQNQHSQIQDRTPQIFESKTCQPTYYDAEARAKVRAERAKAMEEAQTVEQVEDTPTPPAFSTTDADFDSLDI